MHLVKYRSHTPDLNPRRTKLEVPGWGGQREPRKNGPGDVRIPDASAGASPEASPEPDTDGAVCRLRLTVPAALKRTGKEMKFVIEGADENGTPDPSLGSTLADVGAQEGMGAPYAARLMRLNYLAPTSSSQSSTAASRSASRRAS
jgi:hypothetical protein